MLLPKDRLQQMFDEMLKTIFVEGGDYLDLLNKAKKLCELQIQFLEDFTPGSAWCFGGYEENGDVKQIRVSEYIRIMKNELNEL